MTEANLHLLGPVIVTCPSLRSLAVHMDGLQIAVFGGRFGELAEDDGQHTIYALLEEPSSRPLTELMLALAFGCAERFLGEARSRELAVLFAFEPPADPTPYQSVFGGRVAFGAARSGIRFPRALLDFERPGTDAALATMLSALAKEHFPVPESTSWTTRVERSLRAQARLSEVDIETVASSWRLTVRSLRRRMALEGARFSDVLRRVRFERACQLLSREDASIADIAETLGYSDSSAFQRAFKRLSGIGPAQYRVRERTRAGARAVETSSLS